MGPDAELTRKEIAQVQRARCRAVPAIRGDARAGGGRGRAHAHHGAARSAEAAARRSPDAALAGTLLPAARRRQPARRWRSSPEPRARSLIAGSSPRSSRERWRPTRSSARWRARRCRAPPTCSSTTSWARPAAPEAYGDTCAAAWAGSRRRWPLPRATSAPTSAARPRWPAFSCATAGSPASLSPAATSSTPRSWPATPTPT